MLTDSYYFDTWAGPDVADPVSWIIKASTNESIPMTQVAVSTTNHILAQVILENKK